MFSDPYLYPNSSVLINRFNIHDLDVLEEVEANYVSLRLRELIVRPLPGNFDDIHYLAIHKYIFQDIYPWAGQMRRINIEKPEEVLGGLSVEYSSVVFLRADLRAALHRLSQVKAHEDLVQLSKEFSHAMAMIWKTHCFREGNTRTTIIFCCQYAQTHVFSLDRDLLEKNAAYVRTALVAYNAVFTDAGDLSKPEYLERIILDALQRAQKQQDR